MRQKLIYPLLLSLVVANLSASATKDENSRSESVLNVYSDGARYSYSPTSSYIGFNDRVVLKCGKENLAIEALMKCPQENHICKLRELYLESFKELSIIEHEEKILSKFAKSVNPNSLDAETWIDTAKKVAERQVDLTTLIESKKLELEPIEDLLSSVAKNINPYYASDLCKERLEITIPSDQISASLIYILEINNKKSATISKTITLINRSGIDIEADVANIYGKSIDLALAKKRFSSLVVDLPTPAPVEVLEPVTVEPVYDIAPEEESEYSTKIELSYINPTSEHIGFGNYRIKNLILPSTGKEIDIALSSHNSSIDCKKIIYPYSDTRVYDVCSFDPKESIESNSWKIKKDGKIISSNVIGEYNDGKYLLYTDIDDEIVANYSKLTMKYTDSNHTSSSVHSLKGIEIDITNISTTKKDIQIVERIPVSSTSQLIVNLKNVEGVKKYELEENGRLDMNISLNPNEYKKIKVIFELVYNKI